MDALLIEPQYDLGRAFSQRDMRALAGHISTQTLWRRVRNGDLPRPDRVGNANVWPCGKLKADLRRMLPNADVLVDVLNSRKVDDSIKVAIRRHAPIADMLSKILLVAPDADADADAVSSVEEACHD